MNEDIFSSGRDTLPVRFVIYLPTAPNELTERATLATETVVQLLCGAFRGVTAYSAMGTFLTHGGHPETEPITVLETYCDPQMWDERREGVACMVSCLAGLLEQEVIGYSVNGQMHLIRPVAGDRYEETEESAIRRTLPQSFGTSKTAD